MIQNASIPMSKHYFPSIQPIIGQDRYVLFGLRYGDIYSAYQFPQNSILRHHLIDGILPGLALYQIFREEGNTQDEALTKIDQTFEEIYLKNRKTMRMLGQIPFIYSFLRVYIKSAMRQYPAEGWQMEWLQNDKEAIRFNMKSCYYFDTLTKLGAPELTASFCRVDDLVYGDMSPYLEWKRTQTISRGAGFCDFCFACKNKSK